jgi:hypothetical protein
MNDRGWARKESKGYDGGYSMRWLQIELKGNRKLKHEEATGLAFQKRRGDGAAQWREGVTEPPQK